MDTIPDLRTHGGADAYVRKCPSHQVLEVIANKWVTLVVNALDPVTPIRFSDLQRKLDGVTQKMLTRTLRELERNGLAQRTVYPTVPPKVEYKLTELGESASHLMESIRVWSETHIGDIRDARDRYLEKEQRGDARPA